MYYRCNFYSFSIIAIDTRANAFHSFDTLRFFWVSDIAATITVTLASEMTIYAMPILILQFAASPRPQRIGGEGYAPGLMVAKHRHEYAHFI